MKGVYSYEYMESWERFDETLLPEKKKKAFYSNLSIKDNKNADCKNPQKVFKEYGLKT